MLIADGKFQESYARKIRAGSQRYAAQKRARLARFSSSTASVSVKPETVNKEKT